MFVYGTDMKPFISLKRLEREQKLNTALLQSGKFKDALESLLDRLGEAEELMANQKPLSVEYKVAKAQAQEQKVRWSFDKSTALYRSLLFKLFITMDLTHVGIL